MTPLVIISYLSLLTLASSQTVLTLSTSIGSGTVSFGTSYTAQFNTGYANSSWYRYRATAPAGYQITNIFQTYGYTEACCDWCIVRNAVVSAFSPTTSVLGSYRGLTGALSLGPYVGNYGGVVQFDLYSDASVNYLGCVWTFNVSVCPEGSFCATGGTTSSACSAGRYCPLGSSAPTLCPGGTFGSLPNLSASTCSGQCSAGYFCPAGSSTATANNCPVGSYCPLGSSAATPCPGGTFGSAAFLSVPSCSGLCSAGYFCPAGSTTATAFICPLGSFCPLGSSNATVCPGGMYGVSSGMSSCSGQCNPGYYCHAGSTNATSFLCPAGSYCPAGSSTYTLCPAGTYGSTPGLSSISCSGPCSLCSTGSTTLIVGSASTTPTQSATATGSSSCYPTTASASITETGTPSASATATLSQSLTLSPSASLTASISQTGSASQLFTPFASSTRSRTQTASASLTETITLSFVVSVSSTQTLPASPSSTPSASSTGSGSQVFSASVTGSRTQSCTSSVMLTPSQSATSIGGASMSTTRSGASSPSQSLSVGASASVTMSPLSTPSLTATQTRSAPSTPSVSRTRSSTQTRTGSQTHTRSGSPTQTSSRSQSSTPSLAASQVLVMSVSMTASAAAGASPTQVQSSRASSSSSASMSASQLSSVTMVSHSGSSSMSLTAGTRSPSQGASQTQTLTSTQTASTDSLALVISTNVDNLQSHTLPVLVSDSLPPTALHMWLARCPSAENTLLLSSSVAACSISSESPVNPVAPLRIFTALTPTLDFAYVQNTGNCSDLSALACKALASVSLAAPCSASTGGVLLSTTVSVGGFFRTLPDVATITCMLRQRASGITVATASLSLDVRQTSWPISDDAILVGVTGIMRSPRLGLGVNATPALLNLASRHVADCVATANSDSQACGPITLSSPSLVLSAAIALWANASNAEASHVTTADLSSRAPFTLTLSGPSRIVLRGLNGSRAYSLSSTSASMGGVPCNISAVSDDGEWVVLDTPTPLELCGSDTLDCGYVTLTLSSDNSDRSLGVAIDCPPLCPGEIAGDVIPVPSSSGSGIVPGTGPVPPLIPSPVLLPPIPSASSEGLYYAVACSQTGLWTDPASGACVNVSDPSSYSCAYGGGASCRTCAGDALCPGGLRLWPRTGYWLPNEAAAVVTACAPPDPSVKCGGWDIRAGAVRCGEPYRAGSYLCGACAAGYYPYGDGSCVLCPAIVNVRDRYVGIITLFAGVVVAALAVGFLLLALAKATGGSLAGSASLLAGLVQWSIAAVQTVSQAAPASARSLPPFLGALFRGLSVLQLDGVLLHPACTGAYAFESQTGVMGAALVTALVYLCALGLGRRSPWWLKTLGGVCLRAMLLLYAPATRNALALLNCAPALVTAASAAGLDGGFVAPDETLTSSGKGGRSRIAPTRSLHLLAGDPYFVCWADGGAHMSAGTVALFTILVVSFGVPLVSFFTLFPRSSANRGSLCVPASTCKPRNSDLLSSISTTSRFRGGIDRKQPGHRKTAASFTNNPLLRRSSQQHDEHAQLSAAPPTAAPAAATLQSPLNSPFVADYVPDGWYTKHVDLALAFLLAALQAFMSQPSSTQTLVGKAVAVAVAVLVVAVHTVVRRPYAPTHTWKAPVRAALLLLAAACAAVGAWARALDLGLVTGLAATQALSGGAYVLLVLFALVLVLLVLCISQALWKGARPAGSAPPSDIPTRSRVQNPCPTNALQPRLPTRDREHPPLEPCAIPGSVPSAVAVAGGSPDRPSELVGAVQDASSQCIFLGSETNTERHQVFEAEQRDDGIGGATAQLHSSKTRSAPLSSAKLSFSSQPARQRGPGAGRRSMRQRGAADLRSAAEVLADSESSIMDVAAAWDALAKAKVTPEQVWASTASGARPGH